MAIAAKQMVEAGLALPGDGALGAYESSAMPALLDAAGN